MSVRTFLILLLCWPLTVYAQEVEYSQEVEKPSKERFLDTYDYVFMTKENAIGLFKLNLLNSLPQTTIIRRLDQTPLDFQLALDLTYEQKISKSFSINGQIIPAYTNFFLWNPELQSTSEYFSLSTSIEPRYYYDMRKRMARSQSGNNLSGNYFGLKIGANWIKRSSDLFTTPLAFNNYFGQFRFGIQRRIFKRAYFDIGIGAGAIYYQDYADEELTKPIDGRVNMFYEIQVGLGLSLGGGRNSDPDARYCDAFRCFIEENSMFKIGLLNILEGYYPYGFSGTLDVEYEKKIRNSTWSMTYGGHLEYLFLIDPFDSPDDSYQLGYGVSLAPRWYYNLKSRIARGKSANNLSSNYFTLVWNLTTELGNAEVAQLNGKEVRYRNVQMSLVPAWGIQRRIFDHGYFDYKIGIGPATDGFTRPKGWEEIVAFPDKKFFDEVYGIFLSEIKVGIAF